MSCGSLNTTYDFFSCGSHNTVDEFVLCGSRLLLRCAHHHLAELIKVHGAATILIQLLNDPVQLVISEGGEQLPNQPPQRVHRDETLPLSVVDPAYTKKPHSGGGGGGHLFEKQRRLLKKMIEWNLPLKKAATF